MCRGVEYGTADGLASLTLHDLGDYLMIPWRYESQKLLEKEYKGAQHYLLLGLSTAIFN